MKFDEIPVVFECEGSELVGMVHLPDAPRTRGMLSIVAGGPQYRGGVCRMQVQMARELAASGVPVMRFDYRGLGDSEGDFKGFEDVEADIRSAIDAFKAQVPGMREIVLWGGCDAASAVLINAYKYPDVSGIAMGNPWVHDTSTSDIVAVQHYRERLRDREFWLRLIRLQYNPFPAIATLARRAWRKGFARASDLPPSTAALDAPGAPFVGRMCNGLLRFKGDVLLLMSGRSLLSREFDELLANDPAWREALRSPRLVARHDVLDGDQAFSTLAARTEVNDVIQRWLHDVRSISTGRAPT